MPPRPRAPKTPEEALSRALAKTLRHAAKSQGIAQDANGWCRVDDLLAHAPYTTMKATPELISSVVESDKKGRYEFNEDSSLIRAVQGHSVEVDVGLEPLVSPADLPSMLVHGTYRNVWPSIQQKGLDKMKRQYIHMASKLPGDEGVISGMRQKSEVYIYIDGPRALAEGVPLFRSKNGVILSPGINGVIPPHLFLNVTDSAGNLMG